VATPAGSPFAPRLADPLRPLLPHGDPFHEPGQVGPSGDAQGRLERPARPHVGSHLPAHTGPEAERMPGHLTEQIRTATGDLAQLRDRCVNVERSPARMRFSLAG
jgi:hypothetical protein